MTFCTNTTPALAALLLTAVWAYAKASATIWT